VGENIDEDFMNSIEETDPQFLNKLQQNGLDPYLMNNIKPLLATINSD
jgi:hypothetical protein